MASEKKRPELNALVGKKLKGTLANAGQSPAWLSKKSGIGLPTVYAILNGNQLPSLEKLRRICKALSVSIDWVLEVESDAFYVFPESGSESLSYAEFESMTLAEAPGERISVSRNFSIVHQPIELRRQILEKIYRLEGRSLEIAMEAFVARREVLDEMEKRRVEYVVQSEIEDFARQRAPWDRVSGKLIREFLRAIVKRLESSPLAYEVVIIPRQLFLVNYEILNRKVVIFDHGTMFLRQSHDRVVRHFLQEVEGFHVHQESAASRTEVIGFLKELAGARKGARK